MASPIFQKLFVLVLGTPEDTALGPWLEQRVAHEGWDSLIADVNTYLAAQAEARGAATLIQDMAWNGFGIHLGAGLAASLAAEITSGASTWADLLALAILEIHGTLGDTLSNRAAAAGAFTDALVDQGKGGLYSWNESLAANLHGAANSLLVSIGAGEQTFEQGVDSLVALVDGLDASGLGGVASDGRVSGATVFVDANGNGLLDAGEQVDTTGPDGSFQVASGADSGSLMLIGGTDILALAAFNAVLQAPAGATVITPLTSLAEALLDSGHVETALAASAATTAALGMPGVNVLNYDPIVLLADPESSQQEYDQALEVETVFIQLMTLVGLLVEALVSTGEDAQNAGRFAWAAVAHAAADSTLDLTDAGAIADVIDDAVAAAGGGLADGASELIAEVIAAINAQAGAADEILTLAKVSVIGKGDAVEALADAFGDGGDLDGFVTAFTGDNLLQAIADAQPGELLPGVPVGTAGTVTVDEDATHTFSAGDFGDDLDAVRIDSLPAEGTLMLGAAAVVAGQVIDAAALGTLTYTPDENANGDNYASLAFNVLLGDAEIPGTITFDVTAVNDLPTGTVTIVGFEYEGNPLFASQALADVEGMGEVSFSWYADGEPLGVFSSMLMLAGGHVGKVITAVATFTDGAGTLETVISEPTEPIGELLTNNPPEGAVLIGGTAIQNGTLTASHTLTDADGMGEVTWQWRANGFVIVGETSDELVLTQAEVGKVITVVAMYEDGIGANEAVTSAPTAAVVNVNDAPTLTDVTTLTGATEDAQFPITFDALAGAADDDDIDGDEVSFRIESIGSDGTLEISNGSGGWIAATAGVTIVAEDDVLRWTPDANINGARDLFTVVAWDGALDSGTEVQVSANVAAVNDAPTMSTVSTFSVGSPDTPVTIPYATLAGAANENDVDGGTLSFRVESVESGTLELSDGGGGWLSAGNGTLVTSTDTLRWTPPASTSGAGLDAFTIVAWDGLLASAAVQVEVDVFAQPVLDASKSPALAAVVETTGNGIPTAPANGSTAGATQVSTLVSKTGIENVTDVDSPDIGMAITNFNASGQGAMWYSTNGGASWVELTSATAAAARLLDADDWIYFKPDGGVAGSIGTVFTFKAWDQTSGTSGGTANTTSDLQFSAASDTVSITLTAASGGSVTVGNDNVYYGGSGDDSIVGGSGSDTIYGGGGNDTIHADNSGDVVFGGDGNDSIMGGNGTDTIQGGAGNDTITGESASDQFRFESTASGNGVDSLTVGTTTADVLAFPSSIANAVLEGPSGSAGAGDLTPFTAASNGAVNISGKVVTFSGGTAATGVDTVAEFYAAALQDATDLVMSANSTGIVIAGGTAASTAYVYYVENDSTAAVEQGEVKLVAVLTLTGDDIADFVLANFGFY